MNKIEKVHEALAVAISNLDQYQGRWIGSLKYYKQLVRVKLKLEEIQRKIAQAKEWDNGKSSRESVTREKC